MPQSGEKWLRVRDNKIVIVSQVSELNMTVFWFYEGDRLDNYHMSELFDFTLWNNFRKL